MVGEVEVGCGCAERREMLLRAWQRLRDMALMSGDRRLLKQQVPRPVVQASLAAEARTAERERMRQRQAELLEQARSRQRGF